MLFKALPFNLLLISILLVVSPVKAFAADANVGNEVLDAANTTLTRSGSGTAAVPYKLQLNLGNANTWTAAQTFNSTLNANGILNLGDGGDAASLSGTTVLINTGDNSANAFILQQGTLKYLQAKTTNGAENISFGNTTTNPTFSFLGTGTSSFSGALTSSDISTGTLTATGSVSFSSMANANGGMTIGTGQAFNANGNTVFSPNSTNDVVFSTDGDSTVIINGLSSASGTALCVDGSSNLVLCAAGGGSGSLQDGYNTGNTITTTNARDIEFTLSDTATDSNVNINTASGSTGYTAFNLQNGAGVNTPSQLIAIDNLDTDETLPVGLKVQSASGGIATAVDASDSEIITALSVGTNDVTGTNWSVNGSSGNVQTSGDVAVGGGDLTTTTTTANVFNNTATTVNFAGAATSLTMGATFGTANLRGSTISFPNATSVNGTSADASFSSGNYGGGYGSTGTTLSSSGNILTNGNLTVDGTSTFAGNVTAANDVSVNGGDLTTTSSTFNLVNSNATTVNLAGAATSVSLASSTGTTTVNNALTASSLITADGGATVSTGQTLTANGTTTLSPNSTNDITVVTDTDSFLVINGLTTATADALCIDASDNVVKCSGTPSDRRLKKNISNLSGVLSRVLKAQGVRYDLLREEESAPGEGKNIGFIAQDLEVLFPEVVKTDAKGVKSVDYEKMTAVLVESTKEQQKEIDALRAEVEELKALIRER